MILWKKECLKHLSSGCDLRKGNGSAACGDIPAGRFDHNGGLYFAGSVVECLSETIPDPDKVKKMKKLKRILLKLSGEALSKPEGGFDGEEITNIAEQVKTLTDDGVEIGIVIGGGNFWRGRTGVEIERTKSDSIGMLATVMNCIYVSEYFRYNGLKTAIMTPFEVGTFTELFSKDKVNEYFAQGRVIFFAGGTGHPYFSTDMAAALRAVEIEADCILAAKAVNGVYDKDPGKYPDAKKFDTLSFEEVVEKKLQVIDLASSVLCMENAVPMRLFSLKEENSIIKALSDDFNGTVITV